MNLRNVTPFSILCLMASLIAIGCSQTESTNNSLSNADAELATASTPESCSGCCSETTQETVVCAKCGQEKPAGAKAEGCSECPDGQCTDASGKTQGKPAGCCGKCAEEAANSQVPDSCETCHECAEGDSANCKCAADGTDAKPAEGKSTEAKSGDSQAVNPPGRTSNFAHDRDVFHFLLSNNDKITRTVTELKNGVETLTESSDPTIVAKIQEHVAAMYQRVENDQPIRMRDPLYREVFKHTEKIEMELENTANGIRVKETSNDEYVVKVIQAHAKVVSGFVEHGFEEARKNHEPPKK